MSHKYNTHVNPPQDFEPRKLASQDLTIVALPSNELISPRVKIRFFELFPKLPLEL